MAKRYYWLKLQKDFFKRHEITIIEAMENGKDYILFYLKLLVESVSHEGSLRFSDTIPYNEQMLSALTKTNIDVVRSAMNIFQELHMIEVLDDKTIYMSEVESMIGSEGESAKWMRDKRERDKSLQITMQSQSDREYRDKSIEIRDKSIDINNNNKYMCAFEDFWSVYPRKKEKAKAYKCYQARLKDGWSPDELLEAATNYAEECKRDKTEEKYTKLGATFLSATTPFADHLKKDKEIKHDYRNDSPELTAEELEELKTLKLGQW